MYSPLQTGNTQGLRGVRYRMLGQATAPLTSAEAVQQAMATETDWNPRDSQSSTFTGGMAQEVEAGQISASAFSASCAGQSAPNINLFQTATGLSLGVASAGVGIMGATGFLAAAAIPVAGAVIAAAGVVIQMIGTIFAHHAAAARQEQALGCAAIAAANNSMNLIRQAVSNGQMTPDAASGALDTLVQQFSSYVSPSVGTTRVTRTVNSS